MEVIALVEIDNLELAKKYYQKLLNAKQIVHWYTYSRITHLNLDLEIEDLKHFYKNFIIVNADGVQEISEDLRPILD